MQGIGWLKRKAIALATITIFLKHYKDDTGVEHIDIEQTMTGGIPASNENRTLDWTPREVEDKTFGHVIGKSRRTNVDDLDIDFLKKGWTSDTLTHGLVQSYVESNTPKSGISWIGNQVCGAFWLSDISILKMVNSARPGVLRKLTANVATHDT